jgi:hypothetical protein
MPSSRGFLDRFRASGTPGAAAGAGVPADRVSERDVELAALLERLSATEHEARDIRSTAHDRATARREAGAAESRRLVAAARRDAESDRRDAAARVAALSEHETAQTLAAASAEAERIREHAVGSLPRYADRVVSLVLDRLEVDVEAGATRRGSVDP